MGTRSLEATLRLRLIVAIAPLLLAVGAAPLGIAYWVLRAADQESAHKLAEGALGAFTREVGEGDTIRTAMDEAITNSEGDGVRIVVRQAGIADVHGKLGLPPASILQLKTGECRAGDDAQGNSWRGCSVGNKAVTAIVAVATEAHSAALRMLAAGALTVVLLALGGAASAVRFAVKKPLETLHRLVGWSAHVIATEKPGPPPTSDISEVGRLAQSFDTLAHRLLDALARERANSAHIAHELRTPLTAIRAELEAMPSVQGDAVERVRADVARLSRVIDSILVLSAPPTVEASDVVVNLADVVRAIAPAATLIEAPDEALIRGDEHLIALALRNLFENAERHSGGAATRVRVTRVEDTIRVAVQDAGAGLPESERAKVFELYWRGARGSQGGQPARGGRGTGLGLALVRAVAQRHGGTAEAHENPNGVGLEVAMTFAPVVGWHAEDTDS